MPIKWVELAIVCGVGERGESPLVKLVVFCHRRRKRRSRSSRRRKRRRRKRRERKRWRRRRRRGRSNRRRKRRKRRGETRHKTHITALLPQLAHRSLAHRLAARRGGRGRRLARLIVLVVLVLVIAAIALCLFLFLFLFLFLGSDRVHTALRKLPRVVAAVLLDDEVEVAVQRALERAAVVGRVGFCRPARRLEIIESKGLNGLGGGDGGVVRLLL